MKQNTEKDIRDLLIHISQSCWSHPCHECVFATALHSEGIDCYFELKPEKWNAEYILERYKEMTVNERKSDS